MKLKNNFKIILAMGIILCVLLQVAQNAVPAYAVLSYDTIKAAGDMFENLESEKIDWDYMQHLDLQIGAVALDTGLVRNLRFCNGQIRSIREDQNKSDDTFRRMWSEDKPGEGSGWSVSTMRCLFPSPTGTLDLGGGSNDDFTLLVNPTPEKMANLFEITYMIRGNSKNFEAKKKIL